MQQFLGLSKSLFSLVFVTSFFHGYSAVAQQGIVHPNVNSDATFKKLEPIHNLTKTNPFVTPTEITTLSKEESIETRQKKSKEYIPLPKGAEEGSILVFSDGIRLKDGVDYKVDIRNGLIRFINPSIPNADNDVTIHYKMPQLIKL